MINPPAMGVFSRDPSANSSTSSASAFSFDAIASAPIPRFAIPVPTPIDTADAAEDEANQGTDDGQDDDQGTVDEESGVIRCICDCDDDDGFTIQCDRCLVWQHCACFGMSQASVPDEYLCEQCDPRPVDVAFAQAHQQKRKNDEARKALMDRTLKRQMQMPAPPGSASFLYGNNGPEADVNVADLQVIPSPTTTQAPNTGARSRKPSQALDLSNTQFVVPEVPASAGSNGRGPKRKGQKGSRKQSGAPETPTATTPGRGTLTPTHRDGRYNDPFDTADKLEAWHVEFTPIGKNLVADPNILVPLATVMLEWEEGSPLQATPGAGGKMIAPVQPQDSRRRSQSVSARQDELGMAGLDEEGGSSTDTQKQDSEDLGYLEAGLAAIGNECVPVEMEGPSLSDLAAKTYVKQISETASAGVFNNVLQLNPTPDEPQRVWSASRAFSRPVMHGLFADTSIPAGAFISEYRGELYSADRYRKDPINQYAALGAVKPHVHLFPPPLNLAIDARRFGNEARFTRFSCHPNAVIRPILFRQSGVMSALRSLDRSRSHSPAMSKASFGMTPVVQQSDEPALLFGIFAISDIPKTHEITLGWEWDDAHIVHFLPELVQNPFMEPQGAVPHARYARSAYDHTANMVALAERGEFPYTNTEFSAKMNTVAAALLGCVLCACIGSSAAPGGGSGASSNNARKQDCAVAQILRVGNGMSLLNVVMPGKTNRRAKLPDFSPLVGIRRWWRPLSMPPTPASSDKDPHSPDQQDRAQSSDETPDDLPAPELDDMQTACSYPQGSIKEARVLVEEGEAAFHDVEDQDEASSRVSKPWGMDDVSMDDHDAHDSDASSLTEALSGLSNVDEASDEEEDAELMMALKKEEGEEDAELPDADRSAEFIPLKKRVNRTRIKATLSPFKTDSEKEDGDFGGLTKVSLKSKVKAGKKRKAKARAALTSANAGSDEELPPTRPSKKQRKSGNLADPSSPLSSVPSPRSRNSSLTPPAPTRFYGDDSSASDDSDDSTDASDAPMPARSSARSDTSTKQTSSRGAREQKSQRKKIFDLPETHLVRKKKAKARLHRQSIADMGDPESSNDEETDSPAPSMKTVETPAKVHKPKKASKDLGEKVKAERPDRPQKLAESQAKGGQKDTLSKAKKLRRVVSDSEDEDTAGEGTPKASKRGVAAVSGRESTLSKSSPIDSLPPIPKIQMPFAPPASADSQADKSQPAADAQAVGDTPSVVAKAKETVAEEKAAPPPVREEPRVKLSLAEYKRRLAERRTSSQATATPSTAATPPAAAVTESPLSAVAAAPASTPPDLPASEAAQAAPGFSLPTPIAAETPAVAPTELTAKLDTPVSASLKRPSTPPRTTFFSSISAPTAIRSVEIPRSPPPERSALTRVQVDTSLNPPGYAKPASTDPTTAAEASREELPPLRTLSVKSSSMPVQKEESSDTLVPPMPTDASFGSASLLARLDSGRQSSIDESRDQHQMGWNSRPSGFQPIGARQSPTSALGLTSGRSWGAPLTSPTLGPASVPSTSSRAGFAPVNGGGAPTASASPPSHPGFARPNMTPIGTNIAGRASALNNTPSPAPIAGRSSSISSASGQPVVGFNPPRAPRAFMNPTTMIGTTPPLSTSHPVAATGSNAVTTPVRPPTANMSPPSPAMNLRNFAGVPTGPASMREPLPPYREEEYLSDRINRSPAFRRNSPPPPLSRSFGPRGGGWGSRARGGRGRRGWAPR